MKYGELKIVRPAIGENPQRNTLGPKWQDLKKCSYWIRERNEDGGMLGGNASVSDGGYRMLSKLIETWLPWKSACREVRETVEQLFPKSFSKLFKWSLISGSLLPHTSDERA
jgi:hypothetical protein